MRPHPRRERIYFGSGICQVQGELVPLAEINLAANLGLSWKLKRLR